jgi:poly(3-hydroxybutyrate) depolymerase
VESLGQYLAAKPEAREAWETQGFLDAPLMRQEAAAAAKLLWEDHVRIIRATRAAEMKGRVITDGTLKMPFAYTVFGDKPAKGRSLYISMHGGGGTTKAVNDQQWENQKRLYRPAEGVYLAPRAPTDHWNLWHEAHIDRMFDRLIEDLIVFEDVDPNRVYIMGYSAGGDGVYQLAPRMADRWAAASMMAGHPNDASPLGLRDLPFAIHVGAKDGGFKRNEVAAEWGRKLDALAKGDPGGYVHVVKLHAGKGHWMDREDAEAVPWMATFTRDPIPHKVVWMQSTVTHPRFYWLAVAAADEKAGAEVVAEYKGQEITIDQSDVPSIKLRLDDRMMDLDKPVTVHWGDKNVFEGKAIRTLRTMAKTLAERGDPSGIFESEIDVQH